MFIFLGVAQKLPEKLASVSAVFQDYVFGEGVAARQRRAARPPPATMKTSLHGLHEALGARMVDFGGWRMPLQYGSMPIS